jgi:hypothetical protein
MTVEKSGKCVYKLYNHINVEPPNDVETAIRKLKNGKATGHD